MSENEQMREPSDHGAMLNILEEKDKIIVSLKESSTQRDKINENQIRLLSKTMNVKWEGLMNSQVPSSAWNALCPNRCRTGPSTGSAIPVQRTTGRTPQSRREYKDSIANALTEIRDMVTHELRDRTSRQPDP